MFLSVKERARQIASGQFQSVTPATSEPVAPPPVVAPKVAPSKIVTAKFAPSKLASSKAPSPPATPSKTKSPKLTSVKNSSGKTATENATTEKTTSPNPSSSKSIFSRPEPLKVESPKISSPKISSPKPSSSKSSSSKTSSSKTSSSKTLSPKIASPKIASPKLASPKTPSPKAASRKAGPGGILSSMRIGSYAEDPAEDNTEVSELRAACLKQVSGVTGLGGRRLAIVLKQTSSGEWYAALKDTSSDKYLKMWMNRSKTYPTQTEALEAYLVFVKKMKTDCRLFPMSPKSSKTKP